MLLRLKVISAKQTSEQTFVIFWCTKKKTRLYINISNPALQITNFKSRTFQRVQLQRTWMFLFNLLLSLLVCQQHTSNWVYPPSLYKHQVSAWLHCSSWIQDTIMVFRSTLLELCVRSNTPVGNRTPSCVVYIYIYIWKYIIYIFTLSRALWLSLALWTAREEAC